MDTITDEDDGTTLHVLSTLCNKEVLKVKLECDASQLHTILQHLVKQVQLQDETLQTLAPKLDRVRSQVKENSERLTSLSRRQHSLEQKFLKYLEATQQSRGDAIMGKGLERLQSLEVQMQEVMRREPSFLRFPSEIVKGDWGTHGSPEMGGCVPEWMEDIFQMIEKRMATKLQTLKNEVLHDCQIFAKATVLSFQGGRLREDSDSPSGTMNKAVDALYAVMDMDREEIYRVCRADTTMKLKTLHKLPCFGVLQQRLKKQEEAVEYFSKRLAKYDAQIDGKAERQPVETFLQEFTTAQQRYDSALSNLQNRITQLDDSKADASLHKKLQDAWVGILDIEDLRTEVAEDIDHLNTTLKDVKDHLKVLTEENDAFREALQQLKDASASTTVLRKAAVGREGRAHKGASVLARLSEISRLNPEWAEVNQHRLRAALASASLASGNSPLNWESSGVHSTPVRAMSAADTKPMQPDQVPNSDAIPVRSTLVCGLKSVSDADLLPTTPSAALLSGTGDTDTAAPIVDEIPPIAASLKKKSQPVKEKMMQGGRISHKKREVTSLHHMMSLEPPPSKASTEPPDIPGHVALQEPSGLTCEQATAHHGEPPQRVTATESLLYDGDVIVASLSTTAMASPSMNGIPSSGVISTKETLTGQHHLEYYVPPCDAESSARNSLRVGKPLASNGQAMKQSTSHLLTRQTKPWPTQGSRGAQCSKERKSSVGSMTLVGTKTGSAVSLMSPNQESNLEPKPRLHINIPVSHEPYPPTTT